MKRLLFETNEERGCWFEENMNLVYKYTKPYFGTIAGYEDNELLQEACGAIHKAMLHFDVNKGSSWNSYAKAAVDNAMRMLYRANNTQKRTAMVTSFEETEADGYRGEALFNQDLGIGPNGEREKSPEEKVVQSHLLEIIHHIVETKLSPIERNVIRGIFWQDRSVAELMDGFDSTESNISNIRNDAMAKIHRELGIHGIDTFPGYLFK